MAGELTTLSQTSWLVRTAPLHAGPCRWAVENFNFTTAILVDFIIITAKILPNLEFLATTTNNLTLSSHPCGNVCLLQFWDGNGEED